MKKTKKLKDDKVVKQEKDPVIKQYSIFELKLTKFELLHLRDLMSVLLPPDGSQTLSQVLASVEERNLIESMLWEKVSSLCNDAGLPLDSAAPDYIIAPLSPPALGVFQVNQDLSTQEQSKNSGFLPDDKIEETE